MKFFETSKYHFFKKSIYINLRWIGIIGQLISVYFVYLYLEFEFNFLVSNIIISSAKAQLEVDGEKIICEGDRDRSKRPLMGSIAEEFSDHVFITSDNPRSEEPQKIVNDILMGISKMGLKMVSIIL